MSRDAHIPLFLWVCAAICAHFVLVGGGDQVAQVHEDHVALVQFANGVRQRIATGATSELDIEGLASQAPLPDDPPPVADEKKPDEPKKAEPKKPDTIADNAAEPPKPEPKKVQPKPLLVVKSDKPPPPPPPIVSDRRIAVRQHVQPNQQDNPTAHYIGDEANHVEEETVASLTSHDRDDERPTPGGNHASAEAQPGDSDKTRIAESEDHSGNKERAPGERGTELTLQPMPPAETAMAPHETVGPSSRLPQQSGGDGRPVSLPPIVRADPLPDGAAGQASPDVVTGPGGWTFDPARPGAATGSEARSALQGRTPPAGGAPRTFGLGAQPRPGLPNLNLTQNGVAAIVGQAQLRHEREADGERRRSEHRGAWAASNFERWRSAIENYASSVKRGNQTALNTAQSPFATYLNGMHNRIHPIFADSFLASLDSRPTTDALNDMSLITALEVVLTKEGHVARMGVTKTSGNTAFDVAALDSVDRAQPFGPAPGAIVSPDGRVYLHWEFHRNEIYACSTQGARPYIINTRPPGLDPTPTVPAAPSPTKERGVPAENTHETREGMLGVASPKLG